MTRSFYSFILMCMFINTIFFVPRVLIDYRFDGSIPAMGLSLLSGCLCVVIFVKSMSRFPGEGLPEIFQRAWPAWIRIPYLIFLSSMWFIAGSIVILSYARILQRVVNPEFNIFVLVLLLTAVCGFIAAGDSKSVIYFTEILIVMNLPLVGYILVKALLNDYLDWDAIRVMIHYTLQKPSYSSLAAATYMFSGYLNMAIFNRCFNKGDTIKKLWLLPILGVTVLTTTFFIPIGLHGTYGVEKFVYVWISSTDAIRMQYGFIERMVYVFLLLYLTISIIFTSVTWHAGVELIKGVMGSKSANPDQSTYPLLTRSMLAIVTGVILLTTRLFNEKQFAKFSVAWFDFRYPAELMLVIIVAILAWRKKT